MEGFCLKQHRFKTVTFGEIMAQMHLSLHLFLSEHGKMWHFWRYSNVVPLSLDPVLSDTWCDAYILQSVHSHSQSSFFVCVRISPLYSLPLYTSSFLHSSFLLFKKKNHENIWFFAYFLSVFSITGVSFLPTSVWWWCSLLYLLGKQYCIFSAFNSLNYFTFWRSWRIPVGHIEYV